MTADLPRRVYGINLPASAYRAVGRAAVPDPRWALDERTMRRLLDELRRPGGQR